MRTLSGTLESQQKQLSVSPTISFVFTHGETEYTYNTTRILRAEHSESHNSHKAELVLQNSDGHFTEKDLKGYAVSPNWGFITSAGEETSETAPLWVKDQQLFSYPGRMECYLSCIGIPDRLTEDKANDNYHHHWSSVKTVKDLITEIADGQPVEEELTVKQEEYDTSAGELFYALSTDVDTTGLGQRLHIPNRTITKISFKIKRVGVPEGDVVFRIIDAEIPLGEESVLAEKSIGAAGAINLAATWYEATLDTPVTIDRDVWMYCQSTGGSGVNYIAVAYSSRDVKENECLVREDTGVPVYNESTDLDCLYRYKFTGAGVEVWERGTTPETYAQSYDVEYDSEDDLIDAYAPADSYNITEGESRLNAIDKLLAYTGCERMFKADGKIHILVPTTTGEDYDSEYSLASGEHGFFSKSTKKALVIPNKIVVKSFDRDATQYTGSATSAASYALMPICGSPIRATLESDAQAAAIATANISHLEAMAQRGSAYIPMDVGAEIWDYVKITDQRQDDSHTGNRGYLTRLYNPKANTYHMTFGFGGVPTKRMPGTKLDELRSSFSRLEMLPEDSVVMWGRLLPTLNLFAEAIDDLQRAVFYLIDERDQEQRDWGVVSHLEKLQISVTDILIYLGYIDSD